MEPDRRVFLGWDGPTLPRAAEWLLRERGLDLSGHLIVVPGGRAGRLLRAALVEAVRDARDPTRSGSPPGGLSPPTIVTPGELGAALVQFATPPAGPIARRIAWIAALRATDPAVLATLLFHPPQQEDTPGLARVAVLLESWSAEIAAGGRRLDDVAAVGETVPDFADAARWAAAGEIQAAYERILAEHALHDPDLALLGALQDPGAAPMRTCRFVLIGVPELSQVARMALAACGDAVALVAAPASEHDRFDEWGCARTDRWGDAPGAPPAPLPSDRFLVADGPDQQAASVLAAIASLGGAFSAEDIVVGVPDEEVAPRLITAGRRVGSGPGLEFRPAAGRPFAQTSLYSLIRAIRDYIAEYCFASLAALVRHPDIERCIARRLAGADGVPATAPRRSPARQTREHWLGLLDQYASQGLPDQARGPWRVPHPAHRQILESVRDEVHAILGPLIDPAAQSSQDRAPAHTPNDWGRALLETLARIFEGSLLNRDNRTHDQIIAACNRVREVAQDLARGPTTALSPSDSLTLILDALAGQSVPAAPSRDSIEMLGWLELPLDPAPVAIITGLNEGVTPARPSVLPLLPERLRESLGLATGRSRLARDAYLLSLIASSRPHVWAIAGRRAAQGDPLAPSRLLFLGDDAAAVERLRVFTGLDDGRVLPPVRRRALGSATARFRHMPVEESGLAAILPTSLAVTAFARYIRSPYEFYLRDVLRADHVEEPEPEMSPMLFGTLIHDALAALVRVDAARSDDPARVRQALDDLLSAAARDRIGPRPRAPIALQVDVARQRLQILADHQARRAGEGWRILAAERRVERGGASITVDGKPMGLHGAIDRIDRHEDGRIAVLDYKTGEKQKEPDKAHRAGRSGDKRWIDLQLPLYRHLVAAMARSGSLAGDAPHRPTAAVASPSNEPPLRIQLGYVRIGASPEHIGFCDADWSPEELESADETARSIIRSIRAGDFRHAQDHSEHRIIEALCDPATDVAEAQP